MNKKINRLKKWIFILCFLIIGLVGYGLFLYYHDSSKNNQTSNLIPIITVLITAVTTVNVTLFNYFFKLNDQFTGVRPIWKFHSFPYKIKFYTLDGSNTVADYIEYYLTYHDDKKNNWEIYKLNNFPNNSMFDSNEEIDLKKLILKDFENESTQQNELTQITQQKETHSHVPTVSPNISNTPTTNVTTTNTTTNPNNVTIDKVHSNPSKIVGNKSNYDEYKKYFDNISGHENDITKIIEEIYNNPNFNKNIGVIISSTTIYGEKTYNIDGPDLKGALIIHKGLIFKLLEKIKFIHFEYNPIFYFGDYNHKSKKLAKELINKINK